MIPPEQHGATVARRNFHFRKKAKKVPDTCVMSECVETAGGFKVKVTLMEPN